MPLNRRKFLQKSAATTAGAAIAGAVATPSAQAAANGDAARPGKRF